MRVIHITEALGGGLRTAVTNYISATPEIDHTLFARTREAHETTAIPVQAHVKSYSGGLAGFYANARRVVVAGDFDIVHLHSSFAGVLRALLPRSCRIVYSPHCYAMEARHSRPKTAAYWAIESALAQRPQLLTAVSPWEGELGHRLSKRMQVHLVPNAVLPSTTLQPRRDPGSNDRPTVAMLGRIDTQKGPEYFAEVAAAGRDRYRFLWIGDGDEGRVALLRAGVEITGWVAHDRARELLAEASLYVHTAAWEGGPLATLEAADAGCPVICRDIPSMRSLGYQTAGTSPTETAAAVERYFTDAAYRARTRCATSELLVTYSVERMSTELRAAYTIALGR